MKRKFKSSLMATTMIAGIAIGAPAFAQMPAADTPTNTQGEGAPAAPSDEFPEAGIQSNESSTPAEPTSTSEIVITGTLIRNPNLVASAPVTVVGQDEIRLRQNNTAEETLRTIPGVSPGTGAQVNNGQVGASFVNLRSLGTNRNIVLLDGVRVVPFDQLLRVDLNNIPLALVDRVDVLTGGASSTYGADAVAGVINFITRRDFSGMELSVSDQITSRGDGHVLRGDLTLGANFDDGRGNAVVSIGYQESDPVYHGGSERPWSNLAVDSADPGFLPLAGSSTTTPARFDTAAGNLQVGPNGDTLVPYSLPFNFAPYNIFQTPFKRYNLYSAGHYDITDNLTVYGRGLFSHNSVKTIIAPSGVFASSVEFPLSNPFLTDAQAAAFCAAIDLDPVAPDIQAPTAARCAAARAATDPDDPDFMTTIVGLRRRTDEVGPRLSDFQTRTWDFRAGLRGDITEKIGFDLYGARGITNSVQNISGYTLLSRVREALMATDTTTCLSGNPDCVPLNVFGSPGTITPAMVGFIEGTSAVTTEVRLSQARGTINGDSPLQLWGRDPVSFAIGAEYRKYGSDLMPDSLAQSGDLGGFGGAPAEVHGGLDVYEGFAEVIAPIVSDRPFFHELQLEAGIRRSGYSVDATQEQLDEFELDGTPKFSTTTWKVAGSWAPVRDIKIRGTYNRAVRAPNISELFSPLGTGLTNLNTDPCAGSAPLTNATLRAVCLAQGAPLGKIGSIENPTAGQANLTAGGHLGLRPEKATTWTVGTVLRPSFVPGLSATVDYYKIRVNEAITLPTSGDLVDACFGNLTDASVTSPACMVIRRNAISGSLDGDPLEVPGLFARLSNLGKITTDGVDVTLDYRRQLGSVLNSPAKIALTLGGNWTRSQKFQAIAYTSEQFPIKSVNRECVGYYSTNCGFPTGQLMPKVTWNQRTTLSLGRVDLSVLWRHIGKMRYEALASDCIERGFEDPANRGTCLTLFKGTVNSRPTTSPLFGLPGDLHGKTVDFNRIPAYNYFDFATRFNVNEHFDLTFTVMNLLDKDPPIVGSKGGSTSANSGNTFPATYDPLGRRFAAGARIKF